MWYGWQILIPGILSDCVVIGGAIADSNASPGYFASGRASGGFGVMIAGVVGHAISGPIVHLSNGQPGRAAISLLIEGVVPAALITAASFASRYPTPEAIYGILPATWMAGMAIDTALLARKEVKPEPAPSKEKDTSISLSPLVVPPLRAARGDSALSKQWSRETPVGLGLVGRF